MMPEQKARTPLLEIRDLSLSFHQQTQLAIDRVSLNITAGSTLGLVGASGAGKSSIARAVLRLNKPHSGDILFKGASLDRMDPEALKATRQRIQLIFQEPSGSLSPRRTVEQTLLEPLQHFALGDAVYRNRKIRETLHIVGLDQSALQRYPHQFSSGQQQRIAIARALVTDPDLLIADEAVSALDVSIQAQILQLIQTLQSDLGITFLFISHDLAVIRQIADDVAVMYQGQLLEQAPADQFFSEPAHPYSKALLSFARGETPVNFLDDKWHLERSRNSTCTRSSCVFKGFCAEKMPVCEQFEPLIYDMRTKNQHFSGSHCVKCHLYNEVKTDDQ
ncbi:MAG: ABC transporter ATP-binding protein [Lysobacterales bacterium]